MYRLITGEHGLAVRRVLTNLTGIVVDELPHLPVAVCAAMSTGTSASSISGEVLWSSICLVTTALISQKLDAPST